MRGKCGWVRILEATIAVMIVAGVMLTAYTGSGARVFSIDDYAEEVVSGILSDLVSDSSLRLVVLNVSDDDFADRNFRIVNDYVASQILDGFGYSLRICDLEDDYDFCKMKSDVYIATIDKDVYVGERIVAAEVAGAGEAVYDPKKVKIYFWEGEPDNSTCIAQCDAREYEVVCAENNMSSVKNACLEIDGCLTWEEAYMTVDVCESGACSGGVCI
jgi:hypothetical protein